MPARGKRACDDPTDAPDARRAHGAPDAKRARVASVPNPDASLRSISRIDMSCDDELDVPDPLPPHHFSWLFAGKPKSGKTNLIMNLITQPNRYYHQKFNRIYFFSKSIHTVDKRLNLPKERIITTFDFATLDRVLTELEQANKIFKAKTEGQPHNLIVLDDVVSKFKRDVDELQAMVFNRRHYHLSVIMVTQVYNKIPLELRKCCDTLSIFYTAHRKEVRDLYEEFLGHLTKDQMDAMWRYVFDRPHVFLFIRADIVPAMDGLYKNFDQIIMEQDAEADTICL